LSLSDNTNDRLARPVDKNEENKNKHVIIINMSSSFMVSPYFAAKIVTQSCFDRHVMKTKCEIQTDVKV